MQANILFENDSVHRSDALNPHKSFIVQAPAGSGKTELLIQRLLVLLNNVNAPEEILAITFTKKAANEMRSRVIKALKFASISPEPEQPHTRKTWHLAKNVLKRDAELGWSLINNPNQLRIQTIDSLCTYLTKQLPLLSNFGAQPSIAENPTYLYSEAIQEVLYHLEENYDWSSAITKLLLHLDNNLNKLHDLFVQLLGRRDQWLSYLHFATDVQTVKARLESQLQAVINDALNSARKHLPQNLIAELVALCRYACGNLHKDFPYADLPPSDYQYHADWTWIAKFLLTNECKWRKKVDSKIGFPAVSAMKNISEKNIHLSFRERYQTLITALHDHEPFRLALEEILHLPDAYYTEKQWEILQCLLQVLKITAAQLRLIFQQYGQIDFIENASAALMALGSEDNPTDLALSLDYQIKHILVDEFQDTSFNQYQLLEKLISGWQQHDGRSLFVVGDPMQSIYRFREAEVGLFIRMQTNGIGNIKLIPLKLAVNFRSHAPIIDWNNEQFSRIFPIHNDIATGAVTYSHSVCHSNKNKTNAVVNVKGFSSEDDEEQNKHIIQTILHHQETSPDETIAILVRSRSTLKSLMPALKKSNIHFSAVDIDPLLNRQCVQDLLALTCALLHPGDRIAWLSVLRAPWCGLSLNDLHIIAGDSPYHIIWERLIMQSVLEKLSEHGQIVLQRILPILKQQITERDRLHLRVFIENTWQALGGPATLTDKDDLQDAKTFFELLNNFGENLKAINIDLLKDKITQLYAAMQNINARVQIMTIHSAKGLEFDTVILPYLEKKPSHDEKSLLLWLERPLLNGQTPLLLAPIYATGADKDTLYQYIQRQHKIKNDYESDRVLYVATTRAKKNLYLLFNIKKIDDGEIQIAPGSFLSKLAPHLKQPLSPALNLKIPAQENIQHKKYLSRLHKNWRNPLPLIKSTSSSLHKQKTGFVLANDHPRLLGVVIHRVLQQISLNSLRWWQSQNKENKLIFLEQQLHFVGVLPTHLHATKNKAYDLIEKMLKDKRGAWILQPHVEHRSELALTLLIENTTQLIVIDRTFVDENNTRWIIDYKTTTYTQTDLDAFLIDEQQKYLEKMQVYARAMRELDDRPIRLGLYFPALCAWKEWSYADFAVPVY